MERRQGDPNPSTLGGEILRKSLWLLSQEASDLVLAFTFTWVALRRLGPETFGLLSLTQAVLNLSSLGTYNLEFALIRLVPEFRSQARWGNARKVIALVATVKAGLALTLAGLLFLLAPLIADFYNQPVLAAAIRVGCLSLLAAGMAEIGAQATLGLLHPEVRTAMTTVRRLVEVSGLLIVTGLGFELPAVVLVLATADTLAAAGYSLATIHYLRRDPPSDECTTTRALLGRSFRYATPIMGARVTEIGGKEIGKLVLGRLAPPEALGYYSVARLAFERLMTLLSQAPLASVPVLADRQADGGAHGERGVANKATLQLFTYQGIAGNLISMVMWVVAPAVVLVLGGADFAPAAPVLRAYTLAVVLWSGTAAFHALSLVRERTEVILALNLSAMLVAVAMYGALVPRWGASGAALADGLGQVAAFVVGLGLMQRLFGLGARRVVSILLHLVVPTMVLTLPVVLMRLSGPGAYAWTLLGLASYITWLMSLDYLPYSAWSQLEASDWHLPTLNRLKAVLVSPLQKYHRLVIQTRKWFQELAS